MTRPAPGLVSLVGAGPGDPELLTLRAVARLAAADLVLFDALVDEAALKHAPRARWAFVGKRAGRHSISQETIERVMIRSALRGERVVRLKSGDPFVFGRGGEELNALVRAGVPCEIVPGVTAATAAGAVAGVPLTHRGIASAVVFVTGHECAGKTDETIDWAAYARLRATLCVYMGTRNLASIAEKIAEGGLSKDTPVALVSRASWPDQRIRFFTLGELSAGFSGEADTPALAIIGEVARIPAEAAELAMATAVAV